MMEYFPASGHKPTLEACLEKVDQAEVVVVLVAHRYGWVPDGPSNGAAKSITWVECEHARENGKEVLAFLVEPKYPWPLELYENFRLIEDRGKPMDQLLRTIEEVKRNEARLVEFKNELSRYPRSEFTDAASVRALVSEALADWRRRHEPSAAAASYRDPEAYLKALEDDTRQIRITGLKTKRPEPYVFGIDEIYIPLTTLDAGMEKLKQRATRSPAPPEQQRRIALEQALTARKVVIIGDPGSGKSTFLRRVAFELCRNMRGSRPRGTTPFLAEDDRRVPVLIRVPDLAGLLDKDQAPKPADSPDWIPYFLVRQSAEYRWGVDEGFFRRKFEEGKCLVMVDGLDEAPERRMRERIARLFERATAAFGKCDFLVSTRPQTFVGDSVLDDFRSVRIGDLEEKEIRAFFGHFTKALALNETEAKIFTRGLETALASRPEIRVMAANPVMLMALAVLQHNDQRLPEYRVELYGSVLTWLAAARERHPGRPPAEKCLKSMRRLALAMQDASGGRRVQIPKREAAEIAAATLGGTVDANEELLEREIAR